MRRDTVMKDVKVDGLELLELVKDLEEMKPMVPDYEGV